MVDDQESKISIDRRSGPATLPQARNIQPKNDLVAGIDRAQRLAAQSSDPNADLRDFLGVDEPKPESASDTASDGFPKMHRSAYKQKWIASGIKRPKRIGWFTSTGIERI